MTNSAICARCTYVSYWDKEARCAHPDFLVDLVSGKPLVLCTEQRYAESAACGKPGRLFKATLAQPDPIDMALAELKADAARAQVLRDLELASQHVKRLEGKDRAACNVDPRWYAACLVTAPVLGMAFGFFLQLLVR